MGRGAVQDQVTWGFFLSIAKVTLPIVWPTSLLQVVGGEVSLPKPSPHEETAFRLTVSETL